MELHTIGAWIASKDELSLKLLPPYVAQEKALNAEMAAALGMSGRAPLEMLDDLVDRANGITIELSSPFELDAPDIDAGGAALIRRLQAQLLTGQIR
jgi:hypothetical protein